MIKNFLALAIVCISLSACQSYQITNGELPQELVPQAKALVGHYTGSSSLVSDWPNDSTYPDPRESLQAVVSLNGRTPSVQFSQDFIAAGCHSRVGKLISLEAYGIQALAQFEFDPGSCADQVSGRTLNVYFSASQNRKAHFMCEVSTGARDTGSSRPGVPEVVQYGRRGEFDKK